MDDCVHQFLGIQQNCSFTDDDEYDDNFVDPFLVIQKSSSSADDDEYDDVSDDGIGKSTPLAPPSLALRNCWNSS